MQPGIYTMSNEDYHGGKGKDALSKGGIDRFSRSPADYKAMMEEESTPTPAMIFGSTFHYAALERDLFKKKYIVEPKIDKRTKAGKAEYAELQLSLEENNQTLISQEDLDLINRMVESFYESEVVSGLLSDGLAEQSIFWNHPKWGFSCKCRPDYLNERDKVVIDLKTTTDGFHDQFIKSVINYKYHWQAAWYLMGVQEILSEDYQDFIFVTIEKKPPFSVQNYNIPKDFLYLAKEQIKPLLSRYAECVAADEWPKPSDRIQPLKPPQWWISKALD